MENIYTAPFFPSETKKKNNPTPGNSKFVFCFMLLQDLIFAFFNSCLCVYWLNWVYALNQNTPQPVGAVPRRTVVFWVFLFPLSSWNRKLSSWPNIVRPHSHSRHYDSQATSYYSSSFCVLRWSLLPSVSVSRATEGKKKPHKKKKNNKTGSKRIGFRQHGRALILVWTSRCETRSVLFWAVYLRVNTLKVQSAKPH